MERAALEHARAWQRYQRSPQAKRDAAIDRKRRAAADKAAGHLPGCTLSKCAADCSKVAP
jgi:hypothetical protein